MSYWGFQISWIVWWSDTQQMAIPLWEGHHHSQFLPLRGWRHSFWWRPVDSDWEKEPFWRWLYCYSSRTFWMGGDVADPFSSRMMPWKPVYLWMIVGKPMVHFLDWWLIWDCGQYHTCAGGPGCYKKPGEKAMRSKSLSSISLWPLYHFLSLGFCPVWVLGLTTLSDRLVWNCQLK